MRGNLTAVVEASASAPVQLAAANASVLAMESALVALGAKLSMIAFAVPVIVGNGKALAGSKQYVVSEGVAEG